MSAENEIEEHGTTPTTEQPSQPPTLQLEEQSPFVQDGVAKKNLQEAKVTYLDGSQQSFWVHKNADGEVLFNMVAAQLNLIEKDYFALSFYNELNVRLWLYKEKKITKQLKGRPWEFEFVVKFYPPEPDQLVEDFTRHLMVLQLRHDVFTERLPFVFEKLALLGSYVAQSELGDYQPSDHYDDFLRQAKIAPIITEDLLRRVRDLHKDIQKGQTKSEAEFKYLELCAKGHHLYGVWRFDAKDSKSNPVQVGVSAHGVGIYGDHSNPRLHMFAWQDIIKIAYRRNKFTIQLKEGVLDNKKEMTVTYRLSDYPAAKRLWKCGVEHHTFFRLVQAEPDIKPKHGLFRWGSSRFRYSGRTQLQTRMASNSYANSPGSTMQRTESGRVVSQSVDDIAQKQPTSPLRFVDDPTRSKDLVSSPEKSYPISEIEDDKKKAKKSKKDKRKAESDEVGLPRLSSHPSRSSTHPPHASSSSTPPPSQPTTTTSLSLMHASPYSSTNPRSPVHGGEYYVSHASQTVSHTSSCHAASSSASDYATSSLSSSSRGLPSPPPSTLDGSQPTSPYYSSSVHDANNGTMTSGYGSGTGKSSKRVNFSDDTPQTTKTTLRNVRRNLFGRFSPTKSHTDQELRPLEASTSPYDPYGPTSGPVSPLDKHQEAFEAPLSDHVAIYDSGIYSGVSPPPRFSARLFLKSKKRVPTSTRILKNLKNAQEVHTLPKSEEFQQLPIRYFSNIYHSGRPQEHLSWNKRVRLFEGLKSDEDHVEKGQLLPKNYAFNPEVCYEHERLEKINEFETLPLREHVKKYHFGTSWKELEMSRGFVARLSKTKRFYRRGSLETMSETSDSEGQKVSTKPKKRGLRLHLRSPTPKVEESDVPEGPSTSESVPLGQKTDKKSEKSKKHTVGWRLRHARGQKSNLEEEETTQGRVEYPYLCLTPYEGPYESLERHRPLETTPMRPLVGAYHSGYSQILHMHRRFKIFERIRHEVEEEIIEITGYQIDSRPHEGPLEDLAKTQELEILPIREFSSIYHAGMRHKKPASQHVKPTKTLKKSRRPSEASEATTTASEISEDESSAPKHLRVGFLRPKKTSRPSGRPSSHRTSIPEDLEGLTFSDRLIAFIRTSWRSDSAYESQPSPSTSPTKEMAAQETSKSEEVKYEVHPSTSKSEARNSLLLCLKPKTGGGLEEVEKPIVYELDTSKYEGPIVDLGRDAELEGKRLEDECALPREWSKKTTYGFLKFKKAQQPVETKVLEAQERHEVKETTPEVSKTLREALEISKTTHVEAPEGEKSSPDDLEPHPGSPESLVSLEKALELAPEPLETFKHALESSEKPLETSKIVLRSSEKPSETSKTVLEASKKLPEASEVEKPLVIPEKPSKSTKKSAKLFMKTSKVITDSYPSGDAYEGPLEPLKPRDELEPIELEKMVSTPAKELEESPVHEVEITPELPEVEKVVLVTSEREEVQEQEVEVLPELPEAALEVEKPIHDLKTESYEGALEELAKSEELEGQNLEDFVQKTEISQVQIPGKEKIGFLARFRRHKEPHEESEKVPKTHLEAGEASERVETKKTMKIFVKHKKEEVEVREKHAPEDLEVEKMAETSSGPVVYDLKTEPYEGPLEDLGKSEELEGQKLEDLVQKPSSYEMPVSHAVMPSKKLRKRSKNRRLMCISKQTAEGPLFEAYNFDKTPYSGPLEELIVAQDLPKSELEARPTQETMPDLTRVEKKRFLLKIHKKTPQKTAIENHEVTREPSEVGSIKVPYDLDTRPYEGALEELKKTQDLEGAHLEDHVQKPISYEIPSKSEVPHAGMPEAEVQKSSENGQKRQKLICVSKPSREGLILAYDLKTDPYVGSLEDLDKISDLEACNLEDFVTSRSILPQEVVSSSPEKRVSRHRLAFWVKFKKSEPSEPSETPETPEKPSDEPKKVLEITETLEVIKKPPEHEEEPLEDGQKSPGGKKTMKIFVKSPKKIEQEEVKIVVTEPEEGPEGAEEADETQEAQKPSETDLKEVKIEEIIEKEASKIEKVKFQAQEAPVTITYDLKTEPYEGPLEDLAKSEELEGQKLEDFVQKQKISEVLTHEKSKIGFLARFRRQKSGQESTQGDQETSDAKKKARIYLKFKKSRQEIEEDSPKTPDFATYCLDTSKFDGVPEELGLKQDLEACPIKELVQNRPQETKIEIQKTRKARLHLKKRLPGFQKSEKTIKTLEKPQEVEEIVSEIYLNQYPSTSAYTGQVLDLEKCPEADQKPLRELIQVYHSGFTDYKSFYYYVHHKFALFQREKWVGDEEILSKVDLDAYKIEGTPYDGPLEELKKGRDLEPEALRAFSDKRDQELDLKVIKKGRKISISSDSGVESDRKPIKVKKSKPESAKEAKSDHAGMHLSCLNVKNAPESRLETYELSKTPYSGPLEELSAAQDLPKSELEARPTQETMPDLTRVEKKRFLLKIHKKTPQKTAIENHEVTREPSEVGSIKVPYDLDTRPYEGALEELKKTQDLEGAHLEDHVQKPISYEIPSKSEVPHAGMPEKEVQKSSVKGQKRQKLICVSKQAQEGPILTYDLKTDPYEGPLEDLDKISDLEESRIEDYVQEPPELVELKKTKKHSGFMKFLRNLRKFDDSHETLSNSVVSYVLDKEPYEGPLEDLVKSEELDGQKLEDHVVKQEIHGPIDSKKRFLLIQKLRRPQKTPEIQPSTSGSGQEASKSKKTMKIWVGKHEISSETHPKTPEFVGDYAEIHPEVELERAPLEGGLQKRPSMVSDPSRSLMINEKEPSPSTMTLISYPMDSRPYDGPVEDLNKTLEVGYTRLDDSVTRPEAFEMPEKHGNLLGFFKNLAERRRSTHEDGVEVEKTEVFKDRQTLEGFIFDPTPYKGSYESLEKRKEVEGTPLEGYAQRPVAYTMEKPHHGFLEKLTTLGKGSERHPSALEAVEAHQEALQAHRRPSQASYALDKTPYVGCVENLACAHDPAGMPLEDSVARPSTFEMVDEKHHFGLLEKLTHLGKHSSTNGETLEHEKPRQETHPMGEIYEGPLEFLVPNQEMSEKKLEKMDETHDQEEAMALYQAFHRKEVRKGYEFDFRPYEGPLEGLEKTEELEGTPLEGHVEVGEALKTPEHEQERRRSSFLGIFRKRKHSDRSRGSSEGRKTPDVTLETVPEPPRSPSEDSEGKKTARIFMRPQRLASKSTYPRSEPYDGVYEPISLDEDLESTPLDIGTSQEEVESPTTPPEALETVQALPEAPPKVAHEAYPKSEPYQGDYAEISPENEAKSSEISAFCDIVHPGYYEPRPRPTNSQKLARIFVRRPQKSLESREKSSEKRFTWFGLKKDRAAMPEIDQKSALEGREEAKTASLPEIIIESDIPLQEMRPNVDLEVCPMKDCVEPTQIWPSVTSSSVEKPREAIMPTGKRSLRVYLRRKSQEEEVRGAQEGPNRASESKPTSFLTCLSRQEAHEGQESAPESEKASSIDLQPYPAKAEPYDGLVSSLPRVRELEPLPIKSYVAVYHSGESEASLGKTIRSLRGLAAHLRSSRHVLDLESYPAKSGPYEGPLAAIEKIEDLENIPLKEATAVYHQGYEPRRRVKAKIWVRSQPRAKESLKTLKTIPQRSPPTGDYLPLELEKTSEVEPTLLRSQVQVYHSGWTSKRHEILREKHLGLEEESTKIDMDAYRALKKGVEVIPGDEAPLDDHAETLEKLEPRQDLDPEPLRQHVSVYYWPKLKARRRLHLRRPRIAFFQRRVPQEEPQNSSETTPETSETVQKTKKTARLWLKRKIPHEDIEKEASEGPREAQESFISYVNVEKETTLLEESSEIVQKEVEIEKKRVETLEIQEILTSDAEKSSEIDGIPILELEKSSELEERPLEIDQEAIPKPEKAIEMEEKSISEHKKSSESLQKSTTKPKTALKTYEMDLKTYDEPLEDLKPVIEVENQPLLDFCQLPRPSESQEIVKSHKKSAKIHVKSRQTTVDTTVEGQEPPETPKTSTLKVHLPHFLVRNQTKAQEPHPKCNILEYPQPEAPYTGPVSKTSPENDLEFMPLTKKVEKYHSGWSDLRETRLTADHVRLEGEEDTNSDLDLDGYGPLRLPFDGPIELLSAKDQELQLVPLRSVCRAYYDAPEVKKRTLRVFLRRQDQEIDENRVGNHDIIPENRRMMNGHPSSSTLERQILPESSKSRGFKVKIREILVRKRVETSAIVQEKSLEGHKIDAEPYDGPLEGLVRHDELENTPLEAKPMIFEAQIPTKMSKIMKIRVRNQSRAREEAQKSIRIPAEPYEGPLEVLEPIGDLEEAPLEAYPSILEAEKPLEKPVEESKLSRILKLRVKNRSEGPKTTDPALDTSKFDGVPEELGLKQDLEACPIKELVQNRPQETKIEIQKTRKARLHLKKRLPGFQKSEKTIKTLEKPQEVEEIVSEIYLNQYPSTSAYTGQVLDLEKCPEADQKPLRELIQVYHSGFTDYKSFYYYVHHKFALFQREKWVGDEEILSKVDLDAYKIEGTPYDGPLEELKKGRDLEPEALRAFSDKRDQELDLKVIKKGRKISISSDSGVESDRKPIKVKKSKPESAKEAKSDHAGMHLSCLNVKNAPESRLETYELSKTPYSGPLEELSAAQDLPKSELEARPTQEIMLEKLKIVSDKPKSRFLLRLHKKAPPKVPSDATITQKPDVEAYSFDETPYEGPLEMITPTSEMPKVDLEARPNQEVMPDAEKSTNEALEISPEALETHKEALELVQKAPETQEKDFKTLEMFHMKVRRRRSSQKHDEHGYPVISEPYGGRLEGLERSEDLESTPLDIKVEGKSKSDGQEEEKSTETLDDHAGMHKDHHDFKKLSMFHMKIKTPRRSSEGHQGYPLISEPYEGPLEGLGRSEDLESTPLVVETLLKSSEAQEKPEISSEIKEVPSKGLEKPSPKAEKLHSLLENLSKIETGVQMSPVKPPRTYGHLDLTPYEGPLEVVAYSEDLESTLLEAKSVENLEKQQRTKKTAILHLKKGKKSPPEASETLYIPVASSEGPLQDLKSTPDVETTPLVAPKIEASYPEASEVAISKPDKVQKRQKPAKKVPRPSSYPINPYVQWNTYTGPLGSVKYEPEIDESPLEVRPNLPEDGQKPPESKISLLLRQISPKKEIDLKQYPSSEAYEGGLQDLMPESEIENAPMEVKERLSPLKNGSRSVKTRKNGSRILEFWSRRRDVNLDAYPKVSETYSGELEGLEPEADLQSSPLVARPRPILAKDSVRVVKDRKRKAILHLRGSKKSPKIEEETSKVEVISTLKREDNDFTTSQMVVVDKTIFLGASEKPITDLDVEISLKKVHKIAYECEVYLTVATGREQIIFSPSEDAISRRRSRPISCELLPPSLFEEVTPNPAEMTLKEPKRRRPEGPDGPEGLPDKGNEPEGHPSTPEESEEESETPKHGQKRVSFQSPMARKSQEARQKHVEPSVDEPSTSSSTKIIEKVEDSTQEAKIEQENKPSSGFLGSLRSRLHQQLTKKKDKKEKGKKKDKKDKKKAKKAKKGEDVSSTSSSSSDSASDTEVEKRHILIPGGARRAGSSSDQVVPTGTLGRARELDELGGPQGEQRISPNRLNMILQHTAQNEMNNNKMASLLNGSSPTVEESDGPYRPPASDEEDGVLIRQERVEQVYRIKGTGNVPKVDPKDATLASTITKCIKENKRAPRVEMVEEKVVVREVAPVPQEILDISTPHTTVHTWHETTSGPEEVTTEVDEHGNVITRTVKTQQVKHTIQKQSYQTFAVNDGQPGIQNVELSHQTITPVGISPTRSPVLETHTRTIAYEAGNGHENGATPVNGNGVPGEFVSSKTVTSGNRTIETITYKVEKDGVIETHVEHRVTIHSGDDIDHDAELSQAILEATAMNPNMTVEKIEVKQETTC